MNGQVGPVYLSPVVQAEALAGALERAGFTARVLKSRDHMQHPCVVVTCGPGRHLERAEYVYAAPAPGWEGRWWFWQPSPDDPIVMTPVAPISDVSLTADRVTREAVTLPGTTVG
jgi:hypothetical protein